MSFLSKLLIGALALSVVLFAGCRSVPIYDVVAAPIPVSIDHDTRTYSIKFRETSVRNDGASVHKAYNNWVQYLDRSIRVELVSLQ